MSKNNQREVIYYFSYLRSFACIGIIILHTVFSLFTVHQAELNPSITAAVNSVTNNLMWAVPSFVMITGALLLDPNRNVSLSKLFHQYVRRIILALLLFCIFYRFVDMILNQEAFSVQIILDALYKFITGTSWSHLWYLYLLIGLYLILPGMKAVTKVCSDTELRYLTLVGVIFLSVLRLTSFMGLNVGFYIHIATIYPVYMLLGYCISKDIIPISFITSILLTVLSTAFVIGTTYLFYTKNIANLDSLWGYPALPIVLQSIGLFSLFKHIRIKENTFHKIVCQLDSVSFGIYLIHFLFIRILLRVWKVNPFVSGTVFMIPLFVIGILLVSWLVVWILKKIPFFKTIL